MYQSSFLRPTAWTETTRVLATCIACLALLASTGLAASAQDLEQEIARANDDSLVSFLPSPDSVFLQKTADFPGIANVKVLVQLSDAELEELQAHTGRTDFVVLGPDGNQTILRDDGSAPDDVAGDLVFTGVGNVDEAALQERASTDQSKTLEASNGVPVFSGRVLVGTEEPRSFDQNSFESNGVVELTEPVETLSTETVSTASTTSSVSLISSSGEELVALSAANVVLGINAFQNQALMITDPTVVADSARTFDVCTGTGDPNGVWTFNHLMTEMANQTASGIDPSAFVEDWLDHWLNPQNINTDSVPARLQMQNLIDDWRAASGGGSLDLSIAPLRLLAIVNRIDLATTRGGGSGYGARTGEFLDAGEARFVFGFVLPPGYDGTGFVGAVPLGGGCRALPFSVIFEYRVPRCDCKEVRSWARQWVKLANLPFPSSTYNRALERITEQFVAADSNPLKPNGSALGQLRTNEVALTPPWELREFQLTQLPFSFLEETTIADNPIDSFNNTQTFTDWVLGPILNNDPNPKVPLFFQSSPFQAAHTQVPDLPGNIVFHWDGPNIGYNIPAENDARFEASLATCGACHRRETMTPFVHVDPATPGLPAMLSEFLTGINDVPDPANPAALPERDFDDLARRELDLKRKARMLCFRFHRVNLDHVRATLRDTGRLPADPFQGVEPLPLVEQISVAEDTLIGTPVIQVH